MTLPHAQLPTYLELRCILEDEFGCVLREDVYIIENFNDSIIVPYFERDLGGREVECPVVFPANLNDRVQLTELRHIIERLELDPTVFGIDPHSFD